MFNNITITKFFLSPISPSPSVVPVSPASSSSSSSATFHLHRYVAALKERTKEEINRKKIKLYDIKWKLKLELIRFYAWTVLNIVNLAIMESWLLLFFFYVSFVIIPSIFLCFLYHLPFISLSFSPYLPLSRLSTLSLNSPLSLSLSPPLPLSHSLLLSRLSFGLFFSSLPWNFTPSNLSATLSASAADRNSATPIKCKSNLKNMIINGEMKI